MGLTILPESHHSVLLITPKLHPVWPQLSRNPSAKSPGQTESGSSWMENSLGVIGGRMAAPYGTVSPVHWGMDPDVHQILPVDWDVEWVSERQWEGTSKIYFPLVTIQNLFLRIPSLLFRDASRNVQESDELERDSNIPTWSSNLWESQRSYSKVLDQ